jgi:hypothetical protein
MYKPFESTAGFQGTNFTVDANGNLVAVTIDTPTLTINGQTALSTNTLGSTITNSSLTSVGTLTGLTVSSTGAISLTSSTNAITLTSGTSGNIDNIVIGANTPTTGNFTQLAVSDTLLVNGQNLKAYAAALAVALS